MNGRKEKWNQKKDVRSGEHSRSKKLTIMVRVEEQARREWENWNDKIKDPNTKIGKFQLSISGKTQFHLEFPKCDNVT